MQFVSGFRLKNYLQIDIDAGTSDHVTGPEIGQDPTARIGIHMGYSIQQVI